MRIEDLRQHPGAAECLADWHFAEWQHLYPEQTREDFARDLRRGLGAGILPSTWVLADREQIWGSASVVEQDMDSNPELGPWLANVFVHPQQRGRGWGSRLIQHVMGHCRTLGIEALFLFTPDQQNLYASLGWQCLRTELYYGEEVTIMNAPLQHRDPLHHPAPLHPRAVRHLP